MLPRAPDGRYFSDLDQQESPLQHTDTHTQTNNAPYRTTTPRAIGHPELFTPRVSRERRRSRGGRRGGSPSGTRDCSTRSADTASSARTRERAPRAVRSPRGRMRGGRCGGRLGRRRRPPRCTRPLRGRHRRGRRGRWRRGGRRRAPRLAARRARRARRAAAPARRVGPPTVAAVAGPKRTRATTRAEGAGVGPRRLRS